MSTVGKLNGYTAREVVFSGLLTSCTQPVSYEKRLSGGVVIYLVMSKFFLFSCKSSSEFEQDFCVC